MSAYSIATRGLTGRKVPQGVLATMDDLLFSASEQGAWYDPSDLSTLFQDAAGTVPVTAVEQPVGRILDKSGRGNHATQVTTTKRPVLSRRVNLLTKTEQLDDGVWFKAGYGGGLPPAVIANDASGPASDGFADKVTFSAGAGAQSVLSATVVFSPAVYRGVLCLKAASPGDVGKIIALRHAAAGTYLLITLTADYQVLGNNETSPTVQVGSLDIALRPEVGTSSGEVSIHLAYASLTLATDAHLPYQWVNTSTDYDADPAKFPAYLRFDGVDDALQTGNIDFTSTNKMTAWAGVYRTQGSGTGFIVESSTNSFTNNGAFALLAHFTQGYEFSSRGTALSDTEFNAVPAAYPSIVAASFDIGGGLVTRRVNSQQSVIADNQGAGQYGNYPLYIGARAGTGFYLNGRLYSLIVRGAQTPLSQIEATELYMKQKMRLP